LLPQLLGSGWGASRFNFKQGMVMRLILRTIYLLPAVLLLAACETTGTGPSQQTYVQVYAHTGAVQCEGGGASVPDTAQRMRDQGVAVEMASCGHDGLTRTAVCGVPDGSIGVFVIPQADYQKALELGFESFERLPDARVRPCKEQLDNAVGSPDPAAPN
tara:strand:+ start:1671 stop:2150 length:480 start_codon:yes stop_codon:yes gene_type:complete